MNFAKILLEQIKGSLLLLLTVALLLFCLVGPARAQVAPSTWIGLTNANLATVANTTFLLTTNFISLTKYSAASFQSSFAASAGTGQMTFYLAPTSDGTNYATTNNWWSVSVTAQGTTPVTAIPTNWSPAALSGIVGFNVVAVTNNSGGTWTNRGTGFNRVSLPAN